MIEVIAEIERVRSQGGDIVREDGDAGGMGTLGRACSALLCAVTCSGAARLSFEVRRKERSGLSSAS